MPMFRKNLVIVEARPLVGTAVETMDVVDWIRNTGGYPWLIRNANEPDTLVREDGQDGLRGVYIDPADGNLVICTSDDYRTRAGYGDYIICKDGDKFEVMPPDKFLFEYEPA